MKRSSFKMIFFALKISRGGVCCMPAALLFSLAIPFMSASLVYEEWALTNSVDPGDATYWGFLRQKFNEQNS